MRSKLVYWADVVRLVARHAAGSVIVFCEGPLLHALMLLSVRRRRALARREGERLRHEGHWFTPAECMLVDGLASLIVPSDEHGPGAKDADVAGAVDRLVAGSVSRQNLYARGLLAVDEWAVRNHGRVFAELPLEQQEALLEWIDRVYDGWAKMDSLAGRMARKVVMLYRKWRCPFFELFPQLVKDVVGAFYISPVAWQWLGYDGPPMPQGYPDQRDRASVMEA